MELNERALENILGGANPNVIKDRVLRSDVFTEDQLENIRAGINEKNVANDIAVNNPKLYREAMIERLKKERNELEEMRSSKKIKSW